MAQRSLRLAIGGALAFVVLAGATTVLPLRSGPWSSQPVDLHAVSTAADVPECATMSLTGELQSQRTVPLVDVWGLSQVEVALFAPVVKVGGEATCQQNVDLTVGHVVVYTSQCDQPARVESDEFAELPVGPEARCDGHGVALHAEVIDPAADEMTHYYEDHSIPLGSSAVVADDQWCLHAEFYVEYASGGATSGAALDDVDGDLCIALS